MAGAEIPRATLYRGARIIVGNGTELIANGSILVRDGHIESIGPSGPVEASGDATVDVSVVDVTGKTIMPTIVNPHGHIGYFKNAVADRSNFSRANVLDHLRRLSYCGVSVFQSLGTDRDDIELTIRNQQREGTLADPELALLFSAGNGLVAPTPGSENGGPMFAPEVIQEVATPEDARAKVRELAKKEPDLIKFWVDDRNGTKKKFGPEIYSAIIEEATELGLKTIAHIYELDDAKGVVRAGVSGTAHMVRAPGPDRELIDLFLGNDVFVFTSMSIQKGVPDGVAWLDDPFIAETLRPDEIQKLKTQVGSAPESTVSMMKASYRILEEGLMKLHGAGVRVLLSGDTGLFTQAIGIAEHRELEAMVQAGMPPLAAIRAATQLPAEMLGLLDRGTLEAGKRADLLILDADPTADITNTRRIASVVIAGTPLDRESMRTDFLKKPE